VVRVFDADTIKSRLLTLSNQNLHKIGLQTDSREGDAAGLFDTSRKGE
jgi:hypothetical protein